MMQTADRKDRYVSTFEGFEKGLNGKSASPIHTLRKEAIDRFAQLGFPTRRNEDWINTNVAPLTKIPFAPVTGYDPQGVTPRQVEAFTFGLACTHLVFVNGYYAPELSSHPALPGGVRAGSLAAALESDAALVSAHLARHAPYKEHAFTALNTAFIQDGAFVYLPKGAALETPVHTLYISTAKAHPTVSHPRTLILAEENTQATVIESYVGVEGAYFTNAVTEIAAGENAIVDHYKLELEGPEAFHIATLQTRQGPHSNISTHAISLGGGLVRSEVNALLAGEGCEATVNGLYHLDGKQHVDNHTLIEHAEPNCTSHELYKGILDGASSGVFRGRIHVHRKAQNTDAYQTNQNLLLSNDASVNSKPQLEIYADEVKCSHGSTTGQMDMDAIFYLRSRGLSLELARQILIQAFADDLIDRIQVEPVRQQLSRIVMGKLEHARQA